MTRPPVVYPLTLADLVAIADAACNLDGYKQNLPANERAEAAATVERLHAIVERAAGADAGLIYSADEVAA